MLDTRSPYLVKVCWFYVCGTSVALNWCMPYYRLLHFPVVLLFVMVMIWKANLLFDGAMVVVSEIMLLVMLFQ